MGKFSAWSLFLVVSLLAVKGLSQDFDLADALPEDGDTDITHLDQSDINDEEDASKPPPKTTPKATKAPAKPKPKPDESELDFLMPTARPDLLPRSTKMPGASRAPPRGQQAADDLDLSDAQDPKNEIGGKDKNKGQADKGTGEGGRGGVSPNNRGGTGGGSFSDNDLLGVGEDSSYKPDKGKGGRREGTVDPADDSNHDTMAETGTIAGIISAVGLALVGAVSSYISYQKKKFCFSIQQTLQNAGAGDLVKAEAPEAVVATEPQVQQTLLEPANAEPPSEENTV
ncbi:CD99 antigen-like protein 2 [Aplochiton taeniatus]